MYEPLKWLNGVAPCYAIGGHFSSVAGQRHKISILGACLVPPGAEYTAGSIPHLGLPLTHNILILV